MNLKDFYDKLSSKRAVDQVADLANDPILTDIVQSYMKKFVSHITVTMGRFYKNNPILQNSEKAISSTESEVMLKGTVAFLKEIYTQVDPSLVPNSLRIDALSYEIILGYKEIAKMAPLTREIMGFNMTQDYAYFDTLPRVVITNTKDGSEKFQGYPSWSGVDMTVVAIMGSAMRFLPDVSTISFSTNRDKVDVKSLGRATRTGTTSGTRIISGSIIGVALKDEPLRCIAPSALNQASGNDQLQSTFNPYREHMMPDQLPLFDILVLIQNEYGHYARIGLFGISIIGTGQVVSINDMQTEITYSYTATDIDLLTYGGSSKESINSISIALDAYKERRDRISNGQSLHNSSFDVPNFWDVWDPEKRLMMAPQDYYKTVAAITTTETYARKTGAEQAVKDKQIAAVYPPVEFFGDPSQEDGFIAKVPPECEFPIYVTQSYDTAPYTNNNEPLYTNTEDLPFFHPLQPFEIVSCINTNVANSKDPKQLHTGPMLRSSTFTYLKNYFHGYAWTLHKVGMELWKTNKQQDAYVLFNINDPYSNADPKSAITEAVYLTGLSIYYGVGTRKDFVLPYTELDFEITSFDEANYATGYKTYDLLNDFGKLKKIKLTYYAEANGSNQLGDPVEIAIESTHLTSSKQVSPEIPNSVIELKEADLKVPTSINTKSKLVKSIKIEILEVEYPTSGPDAVAIAAIIPKGKLMSMAKVSIKKVTKEKAATKISISPKTNSQPNCYDYKEISTKNGKTITSTANCFIEPSDTRPTLVTNERLTGTTNELVCRLTGFWEIFPRGRLLTNGGVGIGLGGQSFRIYSNKFRWANSSQPPNLADGGYSSHTIATFASIDSDVKKNIQFGSINIQNVTTTPANCNNLILLNKITFPNIKTLHTTAQATWPRVQNSVSVSITDSDKNDLSLHGYFGIIMYKNHPCFYKDNYFTGIPTYSDIRRLSYTDFLARLTQLFSSFETSVSKKQKTDPKTADVTTIQKENDMLSNLEIYNILIDMIRKKDADSEELTNSCILLKQSYTDLKIGQMNISFQSPIYANLIFNHITNTTGKNFESGKPCDYYWQNKGVALTETQMNNYCGAIDAFSVDNSIKASNKQNMLHGIPIENAGYVSSYYAIYTIDCKTS